jgi:BMFP domain-containing protein YqiC
MSTNTFSLDDLVTRLSAAVPAGLHTVQNDLERNFRSILQSALTKLDLVTREEFDIQTNVLARTRQKLEALEKRVALLEASSEKQGTENSVAGHHS